MSSVVSGRSLAERLVATMPSFVRLVLVEITERVPACQQLPTGGRLDGGIARVIE